VATAIIIIGTYLLITNNKRYRVDDYRWYNIAGSVICEFDLPI